MSWMLLVISSSSQSVSYSEIEQPESDLVARGASKSVVRVFLEHPFGEGRGRGRGSFLGDGKSLEF